MMQWVEPCQLVLCSCMCASYLSYSSAEYERSTTPKVCISNSSTTANQLKWNHSSHRFRNELFRSFTSTPVGLAVKCPLAFGVTADPLTFSLTSSTSSSSSSSLRSSFCTPLTTYRARMRQIRKNQNMLTACSAASRQNVMPCEIQHLYCCVSQSSVKEPTVANSFAGNEKKGKVYGKRL